MKPLAIVVQPDPCLNSRSIGHPAVGDIEYSAVAARYQPNHPIVQRLDPPLLIGAAATGLLIDLCSIGSCAACNVEAFAAVACPNLVVAVVLMDEAPALLGRVRLAPQHDVRAIRR